MATRKGFPTINTKTPDGIRPNGRPYRVMVVDGSDFHKKQIAQILESEKYDIVDTASNGKEALQKLDALEVPVDLVTTELDMPILDGYALVYELQQKANRPLVVFISEDTTKGVMQDLITMGVRDFILKPINRRVILERLNKVITKFADQ